MSTATKNPFAFGGPITLDNLDQLFSHHRGLTGGWSMEGDDNPPADPPPNPTDPPKFEAITSQDQLDKVLGSRLAREREKYADYDDIKKKAAAHDEALEAAKTEQEKAVDAARKEGENAGRQSSDTRVIRAEAKAALAAANAQNATSAVKLLDLSGLTVGDDGEVDPAALKAKIDSLKESDPYLFGDGKPAPKDPPKPDPTQGGGGGGDEKPGSIAEARRIAREQREAKKRPQSA